MPPSPSLDRVNSIHEVRLVQECLKCRHLPFQEKKKEKRKKRKEKEKDFATPKSGRNKDLGFDIAKQLSIQLEKHTLSLLRQDFLQLSPQTPCHSCYRIPSTFPRRHPNFTLRTPKAFRAEEWKDRQTDVNIIL